MCFGNTTTDTQTKSSTANPGVAANATSNMNFVQGLQDKGFQGYTGQQVANLDPAQQATINAGQSIANNGTGAKATGMIDSYAGAPAQHVGTGTIADNMSPYMNQYVMNALAPQLQQMDNSNAATNQATNAQATGSGAFGDARAGIADSNNRFNQGVQREGVIGNAYNSAFNTAIGAGAQDVSNQNSTQATNANLAETALNRSLGGANALTGVQTQQMATTGQANQLAGQNTQNSQANLTAQYNQWLMAQQYPFQTAQLMNQTTAAGSQAMPATTTTTDQKPNNSGWALAGTIGGALLGGPVGGAIGGSLGGMAGGMFGDSGGTAGTSIGGSTGPSSYGGVNGPMALV